MNEEQNLMEVEVKEGQVNKFELTLKPATKDQLDNERKARIAQGVEEDGT
jgi:hypothetical protein